jgi:hypothetical protein
MEDILYPPPLHKIKVDRAVVNIHRGLHDRVKRGYAAGCSEDVSDGVEDGESRRFCISRIGWWGSSTSRTRGYTVFILPFC